MAAEFARRCWRWSGSLLPTGGREWFLLQVLRPWRWKKPGDKAAAYRRAAASPGINLVGFLSEPTGLGESARGLLAAMENSPIAMLPVNHAPSRENLPFRSGKGGPPGTFPVNLWCLNGFEMVLAMRHYGFPAVRHQVNVGSWHWELETFPPHWRPALGLVDEIWAASPFAVACFRKAAPPGTPVCLVPPTVAVAPAERDWRTHFSLPKNRFVVLLAFDPGSVTERKNPLASIRAVRRMRALSGVPAFLVVKARGIDRFPKDGAGLRAALEGMEHRILDADMTRGEVAGLYQACDAVISLHRSEGFGLVCAEAMALGKPVVATGWSATADFMTGDNSWPVPYALVQNARRCGPYPKGAVWAEADVEAAARALAEIAARPELAARKGALARETIRRRYSGAATREAIERRHAAWAASADAGRGQPDSDAFRELPKLENDGF